MIPLPPAHAVAELIGELVSRAVTAKTIAPMALNRPAIAVAAYENADHRLEAVVACDLVVGASLGAALVVMPLTRVDECARDGRLDDFVAENLAEVFNVLSAVFPRNGAPRMVLRATDRGDAPTDDVAAMLAAPSRRLDLELAVAGYRTGRFSIVTA